MWRFLLPFFQKIITNFHLQLKLRQKKFIQEFKTAKRSVLFADFIANEVIKPVRHRHLVFSLSKNVPKIKVSELDLLFLASYYK